MGPCKTLDHKCNAGFGEDLEGGAGYTKGGEDGEQPGGQAGTKCRGSSVLGTGRLWLLVEQEKNGVGIPEGSSECLEDCWSSDRHRKGAWTAGLGREERLKKLALF